jgi:hypothetical protein
LNGWSNNAEKDSTHSFNSFQLLRLENQWLNTNNLAGLTFNSNEKNGIVNGGYQLTDGDYHRIREATNKNDYYLFSESYQVIRNIHYYGKINYHDSDEEGNLWTGVFDPYRGNPYIIGDSISGANYHRESFSLSGGAAKRFSEKLSTGILAQYFIGEGAKQKDPRPKNTVSDFLISPSVIFNLSKAKIGFDIAYRNRKEQISYSQVVTNDSDPTFFMFKGMGFYSDETASNKYRFYMENDFNGGFQYEVALFEFLSLTEIRGAYSLETIEDGSNTIKKEDAGDWKTYQFELNQQLIKQKSNSIQKIIFNGSFFNGDGVEYTQDVVINDDKSSEYVTVAKNLKFNRITFSSNLVFDYMKLLESGKNTWEASAFIQFKMNNEKYYYIPEIFTAEYSNIEAGARFEKSFYWGNIHFSPEITSKYRFNLSQEIVLSDDEEITKYQNKELYIHDFEYYASDLIYTSAIINCGIKAEALKNIDEIYLNIGYEHWQVIDSGVSTGILTGKIGFLF